MSSKNKSLCTREIVVLTETTSSSSASYFLTCKHLEVVSTGCASQPSLEQNRLSLPNAEPSH